MHRALLASLALAVAVLAGCSDDDEGTVVADDTGSGATDTIEAADTASTDTGTPPADSSVADSATADSAAPGDSGMDTRPGDAMAADAPAELAAACIASGGTVGTSQCCTSAGPFPNTCAIGACSCAPANSRPTAVCNCASGKCWNGSTCM